jgi:hypothetical protein
MEDSGEMVEPVGSGKVYARAEGKELSASPSSTVTSCVIHCLTQQPLLDVIVTSFAWCMPH